MQDIQFYSITIILFILVDFSFLLMVNIWKKFYYIYIYYSNLLAVFFFKGILYIKYLHVFLKLEIWPDFIVRTHLSSFDFKGITYIIETYIHITQKFRVFKNSLHVGESGVRQHIPLF